MDRPATVWCSSSQAGPLCARGPKVLCHVPRFCPDRQLLQPSGQDFELLVCAQFVQAVNADLNRSGVVVGNSVDVFGTGHGSLLLDPIQASRSVNPNVIAPRYV
jgi:hypothetical protein